MKFVVPSECVRFIENTECTLLFGIRFSDKFKRVDLDKWGSFWIFEADPYYQSYCAMVNGWQPFSLAEEEFKNLTECSFVFLSKERRHHITGRIADIFKVVTKNR